MSSREFEQLAGRHTAGRKLRSVTRWNQLVAMALWQLAGRSSLREMVANVLVQDGKPCHLGATRVARSSLARIIESQSHALYTTLFQCLLAGWRRRAPGYGFRFGSGLCLLDSTTIDLCLSMFPWTKYKRIQGAVKLHVGLDDGGFLLSFACVTDRRTADIEAA